MTGDETMALFDKRFRYFNKFNRSMTMHHIK